MLLLSTFVLLNAFASFRESFEEYVSSILHPELVASLA